MIFESLVSYLIIGVTVPIEGMLFESLVSHHERFAVGHNPEVRAGFDANIIDAPTSEQYVAQGITTLFVVAQGDMPLGVEINDKDTVSTLGEVVRQVDNS